VREHGMQVTELKPGTPEYKAFGDALAPLEKAQAAKLPPELVKLVGDEQH
jgi:hypothetical protein